MAPQPHIIGRKDWHKDGKNVQIINKQDPHTWKMFEKSCLPKSRHRGLTIFLTTTHQTPTHIRLTVWGGALDDLIVSSFGQTKHDM